MIFYLLALNGDNITADRYTYVALNGVVEGLAYMTTVPLLLYVGRKITVSGLFFVSGILQLALLTIPQGKHIKNEKSSCLLVLYINILKHIIYRKGECFIICCSTWKILCQCCILC